MFLTPKKWKLLGQKLVYSNRFLTVYQDRLQRSNQSIVEDYYSIKRRDAAFIIALTQEEKIPLVYQYKNGIKNLIWELPAGFIESKEKPEDAARRELLEETGFSANKFELLGTYVPNPSITSNQNFVFLASQAKKISEQRLDINEEIKVELFDFKKLVDSVRQQESPFIDCQSQLSLLLLGEKLNI